MPAGVLAGLCCRLVLSRTNARSDVALLLDRLMVQAGPGGSNSGGVKGYKPQLGCDVSLQELAGAFEVRRGHSAQQEQHTR